MPRDIPFSEWLANNKRKSDTYMGKAPARGGVQLPVSAGRSPYGGMNGSPQRGSPERTAGGHVGFPAPQGIAPSKYDDARPDQPPPYIDDVNIDSNWYSPFQPVWPFGPPYVQSPREWNYPTGFNLNFVPARFQLMSMLRSMARTWGVLATIISTRQDQLVRIPWTIQDKDRPKNVSAGVKEMREFFRRPDGKLTYSQWTRKLTLDLLEIDAPAIYFPTNRAGKPMAAEVIDGLTIFPLIDDAGRRPDSIVEIDDDGRQYLQRQPAFQQIINGLPMTDLDESELMYVPMRSRPDLPIFGYPPTEQILIEASEAVRKTFYQFNFWAEGSIPDLVVTVPEGWTPRQIAMFQAHFDAFLSGNLNLKSKVRFLPGGMKPFDIKNSSGEALWSQRDETLIRLACYAYSVSPAPFIKMLNRSVAQNAQQMAEQEGLYPFMAYWKECIMDPIIQERHGYDDIEFVFLPRPENDQEKQSKIHQIQVREGIRSRNEIRAELGEEPMADGNVITVATAKGGAVPLDMIISGEAMALETSGPNDGDKPPGGDAKGSAPKHKPDATRTVTQRGSPAPPDGSTTTKASKSEVRAAARQAAGHLDNLSHLVLHDGNYPKGHVWIQGLNISIENDKGSKRGEKDQHGKKWEVRMPAPYGYIRGTIGADGDQIDVYLGTHPKQTTVWVIDQNKVSKKGNIKGFDEHKVMLGYKTLKRALRDYLRSHFDGHGHERLGDVVELSMDEFKDWLKNGKTKEAISGQAGAVVLTAGELAKADTISTSTNLLNYSTLPAKKERRKRKKKARLKSGPRWLQLNSAVHG